MKGATITLAGKEYPLRFSLRAVKACTDRYGSLDGMFEAIQVKNGQVDVVDECLWLLSTLLDAGYRYCKASGEDAPEPPDEDTLMDMLDLAEMQGVLLRAITGDSQRTVEAEPPKNGGAGEAASSS